jgi:hypothetical protein
MSPDCKAAVCDLFVADNSALAQQPLLKQGPIEIGAGTNMVLLSALTAADIRGAEPSLLLNCSQCRVTPSVFRLAHDENGSSQSYSGSGSIASTHLTATLEPLRRGRGRSRAPGALGSSALSAGLLIVSSFVVWFVAKPCVSWLVWWAG